MDPSGTSQDSFVASVSMSVGREHTNISPPNLLPNHLSEQGLGADTQGIGFPEMLSSSSRRRYRLRRTAIKYDQFHIFDSVSTYFAALCPKAQEVDVSTTLGSDVRQLDDVASVSSTHVGCASSLDALGPGHAPTLSTPPGLDLQEFPADSLVMGSRSSGPNTVPDRVAQKTTRPDNSWRNHEPPQQPDDAPSATHLMFGKLKKRKVRFLENRTFQNYVDMGGEVMVEATTAHSDRVLAPLSVVSLQALDAEFFACSRTLSLDVASSLLDLQMLEDKVATYGHPDCELNYMLLESYKDLVLQEQVVAASLFVFDMMASSFVGQVMDAYRTIGLSLSNFSACSQDAEQGGHDFIVYHPLFASFIDLLNVLRP